MYVACTDILLAIATMIENFRRPIAGNIGVELNLDWQK